MLTRDAERVTVWVLALAIAAALPAAASDWPQWLGPERDGHSPETGLATEWSHDSNVDWRAEMPGRSGSTPIITGDLIFLNVALEEELELWALDRGNGEVRWKRSLGGGNYTKMKHNMSSPSPVTDGETVWVMAGTGILAAFDFSGAERWRRDLQADYGRFGLNHGYGASPLLHAGDLFVPVLHGMTTDDPSYVLRIDGASGETEWRVERPTDAVMESPDAYTTPAIWQRGERSELVISGGDYVTGHDLATGEELWRIGGMNPDKAPMYRVVASPMPIGEYLVVPTRVKPMQVLRSTGAGEPEVVWSLDRGPDVPTPVSEDGILYVVDDRGIIRALEVATGEEIWGPERLAAGTYSASPVIADGHLYVTSEDGVTSVVKTGRQFQLVAENRVQGYTLSTIAVSDGQLFLRTAEFLYALGAAD